MEDLRVLNERILGQVNGENGNVKAVLPFLTVCVGRLKPTAEKLSEALASLHGITHENSLDVTSINREYLNFARLVARDIVNGHYDGLIILAIDMLQARVLASLTTQQIADLSRRWEGTVFRTGSAITRKVGDFHAKVVPHYSTALLAS